MRLAHKIDTTQTEIIAAAEGIGCDVVNLSAIGKGVPDLALFWRGKGWLVEVKGPRGKLTPAEEAYAVRSRTPVHIVRSVDELLKLLEAV